MKNIFLAAIGIVCLMVSCSKDSTTELQTNPMVGQEVQFSPNQDLNLQTRTVYGDKDVTNNLYPIYWVNGDKVLVYGSTCAVKQAEYAVSVDVVNQNWADALNKTGATGVQWGESTASNFLAIYPSSAATITSDTKATATIRSTQNNVFEPVYSTDGKTIVAWKGHPFASNAAEKTMVDGIMYARTEGARSDADTDDDETVGEVDLRFKPFTTVLKFKFSGFFSQNSDPTIYVQSITVTSPGGSPIAGEFNLAVSGTGEDATATATAGDSTSNTITLNTILAGGSYIPLTENVPIEFDVFTLPLPDQTISNLWTVKVATNYGEFTYKLTPNTSNTNTALVAGKVHHITIPTLEVLGTAAWDPTKWMTQVPQDVYLSELSIPGTWYTNDSGYQATTDLATLYSAGIRAFNIDCRVTKREDSNDGILNSDAEWSDADDYPSRAYLACSGTEKDFGIGGFAIGLTDGTYVSGVVQDIVNLAKQHTDEYVVIVFTFAEKPKTVSKASYGSVRPDYITEQLNAILNTEGIKEYLYTNVTKDTTIKQVLESGKNVIVKINHSNVDFATSTSPAFSMPDGVMASFASMAKEGYIQTGVTDIVSGLTTSTSPYYAYYSKMQEYPIYNGKTKTDLTYYYHQAQQTSSDKTQGATPSAVPTLGNRMDAIDDIIEKSTAIYDASTHDAWFQIAIGGSIDGNNPAGVAPLVTYLNEKIAAKMDTDPSPVGIVLMNHATTTGATLVTNIIEMNGKFYLKRAGGDIITDGSGDSSGTGTGTGTGDNFGEMTVPTR